MAPEEKPSVLRSALAMSAGTTTSRILGFIRDALMFALFPRTVTDAFVVAFRLPNLFRRVLGEGSLSLSFIPSFVAARDRSVEEGEHLAAGVFTVIFAVTTVLAVAGFVGMESIIRFWVGDPSGYGALPEQLARTVWMARVMIFYLVLVSTYAFHSAVLNALGEFFVPALGPTLFNLGLIIFTVFPFSLGPYAGASQAWGVLFGGVLQAGVVWRLLVKMKHPPRLKWPEFRGPVARVFGEMLPGMFALGLFQVIALVNTKYASGLDEGTQSYLYAADRVLELPQSLIAVSLGSALLPRFAELVRNRPAFLNEASEAAKILLFLTLPAAIGMFCLAGGITEVLFQRGAFSPGDALATARVVEVYAFLLLFSGLSRISLPAFAATGNSWVPASAAAFVLLVHLFVAPWAVDLYGLTGLAGATAFAGLLNVVLLQTFFHFKIGPLHYFELATSFARALPGALALAGFCFWVYPTLVDRGWPRALTLGLVILWSVVLYFASAFILKSPEAKSLLARFKWA